MGTRISIERPRQKKGYPLYVAGATLLILAVIIVWIFQFQASIRNGVFADFSSEFEQTSEQVQAGIKLMEELSAVPDSPVDFYEEAVLEPGREERAQELLNEQSHQTLPISE